MARRYSNTAVQTTLSLAALATDTTLNVGDTAGWPTPGAGDVGVGAINYGTPASVEIFTYTGKTGTSFTGVTRGLDGTTAALQGLGAKVAHVASAFDIPGGGTDPTKLTLVDDFVAGGEGSATLGELGWLIGAGTVTKLPAEARRPGIARLSTGATSGTIARISLSAETVGALLPVEAFDNFYYLQLNTNDADTAVRFGLTSDGGSQAPANAIYFEKLAADTSWFGVTRNGGLQSRTAALLATGTGWVRFRLRRVSSGVLGFTADGTAEVTLNTNAPTAALVPFIQIVNSVAAAKTIDVDRFDLLVTGLSR